MTRYFHLITPALLARLQRQGRTWDWVKRFYSQPDWCGLHGALDGLDGCWGLCMGDVHGIGDCDKCPERKRTP